LKNNRDPIAAQFAHLAFRQPRNVDLADAN